MQTLARLGSMPHNDYWINGAMVNLGDPTDWLKQSLSLPHDQPLPKHHYELKQGIICGPIGSGKSTTKEWIASIARDIWPPRWDKLAQKRRNQIEFFDARDMGGLIESLRESTAYVKFIVFEDAIDKNKGTESRRSGSGKNVDGTSKFFRIRHLVKDEGANIGGVLIMFLITQDLMRIDASLREHAAIFIFKGYVRGCEDFIKNNDEIMDKLYELSDNATRIQRNDVRQEGYIIDKRGNYYHILTIKDRIGSRIPWIYTPEGKTYKYQFLIMRKLIFQDLVKNYSNQIKMREYEIKLGNSTEGELKGYLDIELERLNNRWSYCEISRKDFTYIIRQAKRLFSKWEMNKYKQHIGEIIGYRNDENNNNSGALAYNKDPNEFEPIKTRVYNILQNIKIAKIDDIYQMLSYAGKVSKASLRNILSDNQDLFENAAHGHGVYCISGYNYSQNEIEKFIGKKAPVKKLQMES